LGLLFFYVRFSAGLRPAPANASSQGNCNGKSWHSVGWRGGVGVRGRRKYVPVGLAAASMRLTPRTPTPPHL
ncbi:MAG: hypothetical protein LBV10_12730, partial [Stenotrophomonas sp.]|uniref:hypothetical protein n=1 Tax=Stenotrophomonas sp. TaxID=69392 RepID=UPI00283FD790